jgi:hypothetical protein
VAGNFVEYDAPSGTYFMTPEQTLALAQDDTPIHLPGFYHMLASLMKDEERSPKFTAPVRVWGGMSTRKAYSRAASSSSGRHILQT